jgi:hypothetical protein
MGVPDPACFKMLILEKMTFLVPTILIFGLSLFILFLCQRSLHRIACQGCHQL